jgi:hypothetical protein
LLGKPSKQKIIDKDEQQVSQEVYYDRFIPPVLFFIIQMVLGEAVFKKIKDL